MRNKFDQAAREAYARKEGREEGRVEGRLEGIELVARNLLSLGIISIEDIAKSTGLSPERIKSL